MSKKKILVVEDEYITVVDIIGSLEQMGFDVPASADTGEDALELAQEHAPDLILMDINLKGEMTGIKAAEVIKERFDIPVVFLTGQSDEATISKAIESEPFGYIIKPFEEPSLKTAISMALYKHSIDQHIKASEIRYRKIAETSDDLILILNQDTTIAYINQAGSSFFQKKSDEMTGQNLKELLSPDKFDEIQSYLQSVTDTLENWRGRVQFFFSSQEIWLDVTILPLIYNKVGFGQHLLIARDISEWVIIQKAIEKEGITQIDRNMEQFQILNDQIRNPLTLIASYASLDDGPSCDKILDSVKVIDDLVTQLDKGWISSNKVRSFLLRHYRHGEKL